MHDRNSTNCTVTYTNRVCVDTKVKNVTGSVKRYSYILLGKKKFVFVLVIATKIYNRVLATF